jgi:exopolysaccharide production protein ExoY
MTNVSDCNIDGVFRERNQPIETGFEFPRISPGLLAAAKAGVAKRLLDVFGAVFAMVFLSPLIILVGLTIYAVDGGPIVIRHRRLGYNGLIFPCFKFRSMATNGDALLKRHLAANPEARREWKENHKLKDDPRITPLGFVLRRTSLDELPQFLNILLGHMSLVGPRPIVAEEAVHYGRNIVDYLSVRPGLTGIWQVSGRSDTTYSQRVKLDVTYARRRTFAQDVGILFKTFRVVFATKGVY